MTELVQRVIVSIPHTKIWFQFYLIDTAGINQLRTGIEDLEFYNDAAISINIKESKCLCWCWIHGVVSRRRMPDIFQLIQRNNKSLVIVVNQVGFGWRQNKFVIPLRMLFPQISCALHSLASIICIPFNNKAAYFKVLNKRRSIRTPIHINYNEVRPRWSSYYWEPFHHTSQWRVSIKLKLLLTARAHGFIAFRILCRHPQCQWNGIVVSAEGAECVRTEPAWLSSTCSTIAEAVVGVVPIIIFLFFSLSFYVSLQ